MSISNSSDHTMGKFSTALYGHQMPYPLVVQKRIFARAESSTQNNPFVIGFLNHSHTDPDEFAGFVETGAQILVIQSGVVLQNLAIRTSISKFAQRPLNLWLMGAAHHSLNMNHYLLGEEVEAAISGSDGVVFWASDILGGKLSGSTYESSVQDVQHVYEEALELFKQRLVECHDVGLSVSIQIRDDQTIEPFLKPGYRPDAIFYYASDQKYKANFVEYTNTLRSKAIGADIIFIPYEEITTTTPSLSHLSPSTAVSVDKWEILPNLVKRPPLPPLVKVCGVKTIEAAQVALDSGASMVGMILAPGRSRSVDHGVAQKISHLVRNYKRRTNADLRRLFSENTVTQGSSVFDVNARILRIKTLTRPLVVGVFRNQPLEEVLYLQQLLDLDIVQLHGSEPLNWCHFIPVPVIKRFTPGTPEFQNCSVTGYHYLSLIDGEVGGEGKQQDWSAIKDQVTIGARFLMAGGLNDTNVADALKVDGVIGVDVSGGVETDGVKDKGKIERFVTNALHERTTY